MANPTNLVLQLLITAKDQASGILSNLKTQLAAVGVAIAGAFSINEAATFEKALDAVRARADETGPALDALIERVKESAQTLGPEFGFSATQAAGGIKELIAAGFTADESLSALRGTLALAAMEEIRVADAAVLISDAIAQFGLTAADASDVANILAASAGAVAATASDMAEALKYTGTAASQAGLSLTETSAVLDVLAKAGQRGSEAGTGLSSVLSILANPAHAATQALFAMGATSTDLADVLDFLQSRGLNASEAIALFGEQGGRVINTLLAQGGTKEIEKFADQITNAGKSAEDTAKIMQANLLGAFDRFWESLKRVGTELATPKLEPFAKGLDTLTTALNTFASNERIKAFQQALADGFGALYASARDFANGIDWPGVQSTISSAFTVIKEAADKALQSVQSIIASLTGSLPGAATLAQQASTGLKVVWEGLGAAAGGVASGLDRIAQALAGPVAVGSDLAKQALSGLTGETDAARTAYDTLNAALKTGKATQDQVNSAWERLQTVIGASQKEIRQAQAAYQAVVDAQQAGKATQDQVNAAWQNLQTIMGSAQGKIDSARLAFDGLNLQFTTGKGLAEAVTAAHDKLNKTIEAARQSVEKITASVSGQTTGFQNLWAAMKDTAPDALKKTWDSLTTAAASLLGGINALAQKGADFIAGFIKSADLSPVRDLFEAVTTAVGRMTKAIADQFPAAEKAGADLGDAFTIAWSGVVGLMAAVVSGITKVVESLNRAVFETGKFFNKYSKEEIAKIEQNILGLSDAAGEFAGVAARSFDASAAAIDRMKARAAEAETGQQNLGKAGKEVAKAQEDLAAAGEKAAAATEKTAKAQQDAATNAQTLAKALEAQKAEVERLAAAETSSEAAKGKLVEATQKLWELQDLFGDAVRGLTDAQFANVSANDAMSAALELTGAAATRGAEKLEPYPQTLEEMRATMERTAKELARMEEAFKNETLAATDSKSITEQMAEARTAAATGLNVYKAALDRNVTAEQEAATTAERRRQANEALAKASDAVTQASIELAKASGDENKVAILVADQKAKNLEFSNQIQAAYEKEAEASVRIAEALRLKYEAILKTNPLAEEEIRQAKEAADAAQAEATAKKAVALETAAKIPLMEREAQQAALMAGPVGQLTRLYQEQAKEHERAADASKGYRDAQVKEAEGELKLANIKGDAIEVAKAQEKVTQARIAQAQDLAALAAQEAKDAANKLSALNLELAADGELSKADQEQIANQEAVVTAKQQAAQASQENADQLRDEAKASQEAADAAKEAAEAIAAAAERAAQLKAQGAGVSGMLSGWAERLNALSPAAREAFDGFAQGADIASASVAELADASQKNLDDLAQAIEAGGTGFVRWANQTAIKALEIEQSFLAQKTAVQNAIETLNAYADSGQFTAETQQALTLATRDAQSSFDLLDEADLSNLQQAIDDATAKMNALRDASLEALAAAEKGLLQEKGDTVGVLRLEQKEKELALQNQINDAKASGDAEAIANLQKALDLEQQTFDLKLKKAQADKAAAAQTAKPSASSSSSSSSGGSKGSYSLNLNIGGKTLQTTTDTDPTDFLSTIESAKKGR